MSLGIHFPQSLVFFVAQQSPPHIFGNDKNVGSALIKIDTILGEQWKQLAKKKVEELENKIKGKDKSEKTLE